MQFLHCSHASLFSEQWRHDTLFSEQYIMIEFVESNIFLLFIFLCFARDLTMKPFIINSFFFFVNQTFTFCVF